MATRGARPPRAGARTDATSAPAASSDGGAQQRERRPPRQHQQQTGAVRAEEHVRRCGQTHGAPQTVMESCMAANLASPMPGTFLISSMVLKPPLAVR